MIKVYIASPYTKGDKLDNVNRSFDIASRLIGYGFAPYAPLYTHFLEERSPKSYETWMKLDLEWIDQCDCMLRLWGESAGADREVAYAVSKGMPVFYAVSRLVDYWGCHGSME